MRILVDTNVVMDYITSREPFFKDAYKIITMCARGDVAGFVAAQSIPDIFYLLRKTFSIEERRMALSNICKVLNVVTLDKMMIESALQNTAFSDFEDCLQYECARKSRCNYIVTRNIKDFFPSNINVLEPLAFLSL